MNDSIELERIENNNENDDKGQAAAENGGCRTQTDATPSENDSLIIRLSSGEDGAAENDSSAPDPGHQVTESTRAKSAVERVTKTLNKKVLWKLKLWMIIIILLLLVIIVIVLSISLNIALYKDPDEKFDVGSFVVPRVFSGSLSVVNQNFSRNATAPLHDLATQVQDKLNKLYHSSHALGRYFSYARVKTLREGSVIVEFCLKFRMPLDSDLLQRYTLSQEMVSGVLRQHLFDQDASGGARDPLYIQPNATIQDGGSSCAN